MGGGSQAQPMGAHAVCGVTTYVRGHTVQNVRNCHHVLADVRMRDMSPDPP